MKKKQSCEASLLALQRNLKIQVAEQEERIKQEKLLQKSKKESLDEFQKEMSRLGVSFQNFTKGKKVQTKPKPAPIPRQRLLDEKAVLEDSLSDNIGIEHLLESGDVLSYRQPQIAPNIPQKLHRGFWSVKATLDLHGYTTDSARITVVQFLNEQRKMGNRVVRIIHGKGFGSFAKIPVLRNKVPVWLIQRQEVLAFVQAPENDGGSGALLVLLAPK